MDQYLGLLRDVFSNGVEKSDRTGTGTKSLFGRMLRFDLSMGFPLLTTKRMPFKSVVHELLWFLKGTDDTAYLNRHGVGIWRVADGVERPARLPSCCRGCLSCHLWGCSIF